MVRSIQVLFFVRSTQWVRIQNTQIMLYCTHQETQ